MGGQGSGRHEDVVKRMIEDRTAIATTNSENSIFLPNYSGIQTAALKSSAALGTGGVYVETDPIFLALSGTITGGGEPVYLATSGLYVKTLAVSGTNLVVYGSAPDYLIEQTGAGGETDPVWLAQSGGYILKTTPTEPVYLAQSGSYLTTGLNTLVKGTTVFGVTAVSGALLRGATVFGKGNLSGAGVLTGFVSGTTLWGSTGFSGGYVNGTTVSGSSIVVTADQDASGSAMCRNIVIDTTSGGYTASTYTQGTILFVYA
jgi:hypothetical protein